jgi:tRNA pseudouridine13 synthase
VTDHTITIDHPLPREHCSSEPGVGGRIKQRPEDFLVDEVPLYEAAGEGEHIYLHVEKNAVAHGELVSCICRHFGVSEGAVGFAGMKDKMAITRQFVSVHRPKDPPSVEIEHGRIRVLSARRHRNKLRRGHLAGNRFSIRIREADPLDAPRVLRILRRLEQVGAPNYFGSQRFGYRRNNHCLAIALLDEHWPAVLDELLGSRGSAYPEHQRERREYYDRGLIDEAAAQWTVADQAERTAINALRRGATPRQAVMSIRKSALRFWVSALQSAVFNRVLDRRLRDGTLAALAPGDLAWKHGGRSVFAVTEQEMTDELQERLAKLEISPSGPLWGRSMTAAAGAAAEAEREALEALMPSPEAITGTGKFAPDGGRRPLREVVRDTQVDGGMDEHGPYIRVAFDLSRGTYATVVMRELMKGEG